MGDTVQTAIYRLGLDDAQYRDASARMAAANAKLVDGFSRLEAGTDKAEAAARRLATGILRLERAREEGLGDEARHAAQLARLTAAYDEQVRAASRAGTASRGFGSSIQNVGFQVGDLAVQIASGGGVLRPLIQQGTQLISAFGPIGAVIGAVGAVAGALATAFFDLGDSSDSAAAAQEEFNKKLDRTGELMDDLRSKSERTAASIRAEIANVIALQQMAVTKAEQALKQLQQDNSFGGNAAGDIALNLAAPTAAAEKAARDARMQLLLLQAQGGQFDDGRAQMGRVGGTPFDWAGYYRKLAEEQQQADRKAAEARKELTQANEDFSKALLEVQDRLDPAAAAQRALEKDLITLDLAYERKKFGLADYNRQVEQLYASYKDKLDPAGKALEKLTEAQGAQRATLEAEARAMGMSDEARVAYLAGIDAENRLKAQGIDLSDARAQGYIDEQRALARLKLEHEKQADDLKQVKQLFEGFFDQSLERIGGGITEALATGQIEFAKFGDIGRAVLSQLIQLAIQLAVINPIKNWATGGNDPTLSGIFSILQTGLGSLFGPSVPGNARFQGAFAEGGSFRVGGSGGTDSQLVAFRASPDERVTITRPDQALGGGIVLNMGGITINSPAGTPEQNQDQAERISREMRAAVRQAVREEVRHMQRPLGQLNYD